MTKKEKRVITAFKNCIKYKEYSKDYAILLIEDTQKYGWLSDEAKNDFYNWLDSQYLNLEEFTSELNFESDFELNSNLNFNNSNSELESNFEND